MTFRQLVYRNIIRNPRSYLSYFFSSVFSVAIFFTAALLYFHPLLEEQLLEGNTRLTAITLYSSSNSLFGFSLLIIGSLALVFLGSMFRMFLRERRQNFSLYLILGMTKRKLKAMIAWENTIICVGSIVLGITFGLIFSKLMLLIGQNILSLDFVLRVYWPHNAILITLFVYLIIFSLITLLTTNLIQSKQTNMNLSINRKMYPEPRVNHYFTMLGFLLMFLGYAAFFVLALLIHWYLVNYSAIMDVTVVIIVALIAMTLLTSGMFFWFNQSVVHLVKAVRERPDSFRSEKLLTVSNLMYRLKDNGGFNFIIAISSTIALIIITSTLLLAQIEIFGSNQKNSLAYTYRAYNVYDQKDVAFHNANIAYMTKAIEDAGYPVRASQFDEELVVAFQSYQAIPELKNEADFASVETSILTGDNRLLTLIPLSEYNEMAVFNKTLKLSLKSNYEIVLLSNHSNLTNRLYMGEVEYQAEETAKVQRVSFRFVEGNYQAGRSLPNASVVSDAFYALIKEEEGKAEARLDREQEKGMADGTLDNATYAQWEEEKKLLSYPFYVIHFREWASAPEVDHQIRGYLRGRQELVNEEILASGEDYDPLNDTYTFFDYSSSYQTLSQREEETGTSLFVSILVGTVFFIFSACLLYFRLFGAFEQDCQYHRTLDLIGIPQKNRHKLLSVEIFALFFLPITIAWLNYVVFGFIIQKVFDVSIWVIILKMVLVFGTIQLVSYFIARKHYIESIDYRLRHFKND